MMIVGGLAGIGLLNLAAAATPSFAVLLLLRIACSLAAALVGPTSSTVAAMLAPPDKRGRAMAVVLAGLTLAFIVGIPLGSAIGGWRSTFLFAGCLALVAALVTFIVVPPVAGAASADLRRLSVGLRPDLFAMVMLTMIGFAATFTVIAYIGPVAAEIAGVGGGRRRGLAVADRRWQHYRYRDWRALCRSRPGHAYGQRNLRDIGGSPVWLFLADMDGRAAALFARMRRRCLAPSCRCVCLPICAVRRWPRLLPIPGLRVRRLRRCIRRGF